jgi:leucyl/phenylalanyl-tRNA--protein transferase
VIVPPRLLRGDLALPDPEESDARGLVAVGGDLRPERLIDAYRRGIFPWYSEGLPILWHSPDPRFVLEPKHLQINRSLRKSLRRNPYRLSFDTAFSEVVQRCSEVPRPGQDGTWITNDMMAAYDRLFALGHAHSVEAWLDDRLVGGVYGVAVGALFCGESMFALTPDASKIAFVKLIHQLVSWKFELIDCQVYTEHLARFGAVEWPRAQFLAKLATLRKRKLATPIPWAFDDEPSP